MLLAAVLRVALEGVALLCAGSDGAADDGVLAGACLRTGGDGDAPDPNADRQPVEPSVSQSDAEARRTSADRERGGPLGSALPEPSLACTLRRATGCLTQPLAAICTVTLAPRGRRLPPRGPPR